MTDMNMVSPDRLEVAFTLSIIFLEIFGPMLVVAGLVYLFNKLFGNPPMATRLPRGERRR